MYQKIYSSLFHITNYSNHYYFPDNGALPAASFFGFLACAAYALDNFFTWIIWKAETRTSTTVAVSNENNDEATTVPTGNFNPQPVPA